MAIALGEGVNHWGDRLITIENHLFSHLKMKGILRFAAASYPPIVEIC
ncbi:MULTISPECIES: hypothetical protein [Cyanophyceae]|nr:MULTISPECIES: hypothetical protein [Cyanophyceae]